jgi:hypothetical protein
MTLRIGADSAVLDTQIYGMFQHDADTTTGLTFGYTSGIFNTTGTNPTDIAAGTVLLTDNTTNYVYVLGASIASGTTIPSSANHLIYEVVTSAGAITTITDKRFSY